MGNLHEPMDKLRHWLLHPSPIELGEYALHLLPPEEAEAIQRALEHDPALRYEMKLLQDYLHKVRLPMHSVARSSQSNLLDQFRTLIAHLTSKGHSFNPAMLGLRGSEDGFYVYQANEVELTLEVQSDELGQRMLIGSVNGANPHDLKVHLYRDHLRVTTVNVDDEGDFCITTLTPSRYTLIVYGPTLDICIPDVEVSSDVF